MSDTDQPKPDRDHGTEEDWVDFARGLAEPDRQARLERHLESGCSRCGETLRLWETVVEKADQESLYSPPEASLRQLAGEFVLARPKPQAERASLVFDSLRQAVAFGLRASAPGPRQLLYCSGRYRIRLQLEGGRDALALSIVGQILDADDPAASLKDVAVLARAGSRTLDRTLTNHLGEFVLEAESARGLELRVGATEIGIFTEEDGNTSDVGTGRR